MEDLAPFREESSHIGAGIHGTSKNIGMFLSRLRLPNQTLQNASESNGLFHGTTRRRRGQGLQVKREVMLDRGAGLHRLYLESSANIRQHRRAEWQRFGVVLLPSLVLCPKIEGAGVLEVGGKNNGLVASFAGKLNSEIPGIEGDENEVEVFGRQMLRGKRVEPRDGISKGTRVSDMLPRQGRQARCKVED